jgi:hypothetical protein
MDQALLRHYLATVYELPQVEGTLRASLDGDGTTDGNRMPDPLPRTFAVLTAYNPRSMLLPRKVNEGRHHVLRDLLVLGCYRVEPCTAHDDGGDGAFREPSWLVHGIGREEAVAFGRVFRQNAILFNDGGRPELIVSDPTFDDVGKVVTGAWRVRS